MSALTLTLARSPGHALDCSSLIPEALNGLSTKALKNLPLAGGPAPVKLGECFDIEGSPGDELLIINRSGVQLDYLGAGMSTGLLEVRGAAGEMVGSGLMGGTIQVRGNVGSYLASGMKRGLIEISGHVGDYCGAAAPDRPLGLSGGLVVIKGNAGKHLGDRQRRGIIAVTGSVGDYCGSRMYAGSIIAFGSLGEAPGVGMRRGSIVMLGGCVRIADSFASSGSLDLSYLGLAARRLASMHKVFKPLEARGTVADRYCGDLGNGGRGELLLIN